MTDSTHNWPAVSDAELRADGFLLPDPPAPAYARLIEGPSAVQVATAQVLTVLQDHRRVRNTRGCSACTWSPQPVGRNGDPEAMGRRAHQFNAHLAHLIAETLLGASTLLGSPHGPGHTPTAADPPPGERQAPH